MLTQLELPLPPLRYRLMVGPLETEAFENQPGATIDPNLPPAAYEAVFDFGCGCGRLARRLMLQEPRPQRYLGLDINARLVKWCQANLGPHDPNFVFEHHDVYNVSLAQFNSSQSHAPFPCGDGEFSLFLAHSVFTHLLPEQTEFYLSEVSRILRSGGIAYITWFFFDKTDFPVMQDYQNALYINLPDPTNAVIYSYTYFETLARANGLRLIKEFTEGQVVTYLEKLDGEEAARLKPRDEELAAFKPRSRVPRRLAYLDEENAAPHASFEQADQSLDFAHLKAALAMPETQLLDPTVLADELTPCVLDIQNVGAVAWLLTIPAPADEPAKANQVRLSLSWGKPNETEPAVRQVFELAQLEPLVPQATVRFAGFVAAPTEVGEYQFTARLVRGEQDWPGPPLYQQTVQVQATPATPNPVAQLEAEYAALQTWAVSLEQQLKVRAARPPLGGWWARGLQRLKGFRRS